MSGGMVHEITVPQLGVNDEFVTVVEWLVQNNDRVEVGTPLCRIETSKATTELTAEYEGFIKIRKKAKEEAKIKETLGVIVGSLDVPVGGEVSVPAQGIRATERACALAKSLQIDLERIGKKAGIIREKDVREYAERKKE